MATRETKIRVTILLILTAAAFFLLVLRLSWLQLVRGDELASKAAAIRTDDRILEPRRGDILDRNFNELASTIPVNSVYIHPELIKDPDAAATKVAAVLDLEKEDVLKKINSEDKFVWIKHKVDFEQVESLKELELQGLGFVEGSKRTYKQENLAAHIMGFVGDDNQGLSGIEVTYDEELRGIPGKLIIETDGLGRKIPQTTTRYFPPTQGNNIVLTIDQTIQYFAERELDRIMEEHKPARAVIIVMEPGSGEILAMGARPGFSPEEWQKSPQDVWDKNPAIYYNYEPGSTFKIITAAAALEEAVVREGDRFYDPGYIKVNDTLLYCDKREGHGSETFAEAVQNSCNPVFIEIGLKMGKTMFYRYVEGFGFGLGTGIDLPGEASGIVTPRDKLITMDLATMSMGHSIAVTPIQIAGAVNAVAGGGKLYKPRLVKGVYDQEGKPVREYKADLVRRVVSESTASQLSKLLEKVVLEGTGKMAYVEGYTVAGKTGTAQVPGPQGGYVPGKYVGSFVGFAPVDNPRVTVLVAVFEPSQGGYHGSEVAAPAFQALVRDTLRYLKVPEAQGLPKPEGYNRDEPVARSTKQQSEIVVPNLLGYPLDEARKVLSDKGLYPRHDTKSGVVKGQKPAPGSSISPGGAVYLELQQVSGENPLDQPLVPDLTGLTVKRAGLLLEELGLNLKPSGTGLGVSQEPEPGSKVVKGTIIEVRFESPQDD